MPLGFFSHVPCSSSGPAACAAFPDAGSLGVFRSPGVCPSASLVTWVGFQPFPSFSMLLLLRLLAGVAGVVHSVSGCSRYGDVSLVWVEVTLLPFPYFRVGVLLACGSSGVRGRIIWPLGVSGTCCFLVSYLGFFPLASSVACSLEVVEVSPLLSSLRSFAGEGVNLILSRVLVGLPSWVAVLWPPGIDHVSQVRRCSSSVPDRYVASPPLVRFCFWS